MSIKPTVNYKTFGSHRFCLSKSSRQTLVPSHPPIEGIMMAISAGINQPGSESDHLSPIRAEGEN